MTINFKSIKNLMCLKILNKIYIEKEKVYMKENLDFKNLSQSNRKEEPYKAYWINNTRSLSKKKNFGCR